MILMIILFLKDNKSMIGRIGLEIRNRKQYSILYNSKLVLVEFETNILFYSKQLQLFSILSI